MKSQLPPQTQSWLTKIEKTTNKETGRQVFTVRFYSDGRGYVTACTSPNQIAEIGDEGLLYFDEDGELISPEEHYELIKLCYAPDMYGALVLVDHK
jgi:hypothetical protein